MNVSASAYSIPSVVEAHHGARDFQLQQLSVQLWEVAPAARGDLVHCQRLTVMEDSEQAVLDRWFRRSRIGIVARQALEDVTEGEERAGAHANQCIRSGRDI